MNNPLSSSPLPIEVPATLSLQNPGKRTPSSRFARATMKAAANGRGGLHEPSKTALTVREMDSYFMRHPGSPAAVRRPHLYVAGATFVALLGPNIQEGIVGLGMTIEAAFRAFDLEYLKGPRPTDIKQQIAEPVPRDRTCRFTSPSNAGGEPNCDATTRARRGTSMKQSTNCKGD